MLRRRLCCHTVQIQIKDPQFHTISRQVTAQRGLYLAQELTEAAMALAKAHWDLRKPVRLLSLTAKQLLPLEEDGEQISLFAAPEQTERRQRQDRLEGAMRSIRGRFGKEAIRRGGFLDSDLGLGGSGSKLEDEDS